MTQPAARYYVVTWNVFPFKIKRVYYGPRHAIVDMAEVADDTALSGYYSRVDAMFDRADICFHQDYATYIDDWHGIAAVRDRTGSPAIGWKDGHPSDHYHCAMFDVMRKIARENRDPRWWSE